MGDSPGRAKAFVARSRRVILLPGVLLLAQPEVESLEQRRRNQMEICLSVPPMRFPGDLMPSLYVMPPLCHCERSEAIPPAPRSEIASLRSQ